MNSGAITIITGSRLHFGPLAWKPRRGRDFGGWGVMIQTPRTVVRIADSDAVGQHQGQRLPGQARADRVFQQLLATQKITAFERPQVVVDEEPPPHCGFGSGTQLALAIAAGHAWLAEARRPPATQLAQRVERGLRSAVGIHGFDQGGLLVDAGKRLGDEIGELAARVEVPSGWRFVLVRPPVAAGFTGDKEAAAFQQLPSFSDSLSDRLARIVLTEILPAVQTDDCPAFAQGLDEYGTLVGEAFSACQGSVVHPDSLPIWKSLRARGVEGIAQTSWGPTLAIVSGSPEIAEQTCAIVREAAPLAEIQVAQPKNDGATVSHP